MDRRSKVELVEALRTLFAFTYSRMHPEYCTTNANCGNGFRLSVDFLQSSFFPKSSNEPRERTCPQRGYPTLFFSH